MVNFSHLVEFLSEKEDLPVELILPSGNSVPVHFHITEVGFVYKHFIDCGGTLWEHKSCVLQAWTSTDVKHMDFDHRISSKKLLKILESAKTVLPINDLPIEIEYGVDAAAHYIVEHVALVKDSTIIFKLISKKTDCLAPDKCGIKECCGSGCCD
jgi:hypothetical protein